MVILVRKVAAASSIVSLTCVMANGKAVRRQLVNDLVDSHSFERYRDRGEHWG